MNLYTIENIPYAQKKVMVREACLMYRKIKLASRFVEVKQTELNDIVQKSNVSNIKTASLFETAMNLLTDDEKIILSNDFIAENNTQWWIEHWAKSTYYKIKHQAVNRFLYLFYV